MLSFRLKKQTSRNVANTTFKRFTKCHLPLFFLHNFCQIHEELIHRNDVSNALKNDAQFQPQIRGNYTINNNEGNRKAIRNNFVKYFN